MEINSIELITLGFVNSYLVKLKDGYLLIDTGLNTSWSQLEGKLLAEGCLPDRLKLVIITHGDFDHTGNCAALQKKYKVKIAIHSADSSMVENGARLKRHIRTFAGKIRIVLSKLRRRKFKFETFKPDIFLTDGQILNEYGFDAKVIHTPGHTKGSISILTNDGDLFSGDTIGLTKKGTVDLSAYIDDMQEINKSVKFLKTLKVRRFYPGHGKPFEMKDF
ncbi:MAG: MBL fold metallo-hydrolase [Bacteroidota bacterium]